MPLSSYCQNCGGPKSMGEYGDPRCGSCEQIRTEAMQHFAAENTEKIKKGELSESDILYAGRQALLQRAHHANRNYTDPRQFSAARGMIPTPPQSGDRGTPQG